MANEDIKNLLHHLNDMYKAIGVLNSSLADITTYIDAETHEQLAIRISEIDAIIESIGSDAHYSYLKRIGK